MIFVRASIFMLYATFIFTPAIHGQFFTINKNNSIEKIQKKAENQISESENKSSEFNVCMKDNDSVYFAKDEYRKIREKARNKANNKPRIRKNPHEDAGIIRVSAPHSLNLNDSGLPELTIPNLIKEIKRNGIRHPKIVLAQAILETGWFTSSVCRNKHNLFGLTNPRTKQYYEFNHWTESVRAYYTKVQYRYKSGNYLIWLRDIGYAEDPRYIRSIISVLRNI